MPQLDKKYANHIQGNFENALKAIQISDSDIDIDNFMEIAKPLTAKVLINKDVAQYISESELNFYLYRVVYRLIPQNADKKITAPLKDIVDNKEFIDAAQKFVTFITGLPYDYDTYFQVPFTLPEEIEQVEFTKNIQLVKILDPAKLGFPKEEKTSALSSLFEFPGSKAAKAGEVYIRCRTKGYARNGLTGTATKHAYRLFKQFSYLGVVTRVFEYNSWGTENLIKPKSFFIGQDEAPTWIDLPPSTSVFLSKLELGSKSFTPSFEEGTGGLFGGIAAALTGKTWTPFGFGSPNGAGGTILNPEPPKKGTPEYRQECINAFLYKMRAGQKFLNIDNPHKKQIERAIDWAFEGLINHNREHGFIQTCIGLEAVLSDDTLGRNSDERLADRCAFLLSKNRDERYKIHAQFLGIYDLRSKLVHGQIDEITDRSLITGADSLLKDAIMHEMFHLNKT